MGGVVTNDAKKTVLGWTPDPGAQPPQQPGYLHGAHPAPAAGYGAAQPGYGAGYPSSEQQQYAQAQAAYAQAHDPYAPPHDPYAQPAQPPQPAPQQYLHYAGYGHPPPQAGHSEYAATVPAASAYQPPQPPPGYGAAPQAYPPASDHGYGHAQGYAYQAPGYGAAPPQPGYSYAQQAHDHQQAQAQYHMHAHAAMDAMRRRGEPGPQRPIGAATATAGVSNRLRFIRLTYLHLLGAILVFAGLLYLLMKNPWLSSKISAPFVEFALAKRWNWGIVLLAFMAVSWVADYWASHARSRAMQYAGLGLYVIAEAIIFVPLLTIVAIKTAAIVAKGGGDPNIVRDSAFVTLGIFGALTASVFLTRKDFSFLRSGLVMASGAALMLIALSLAFGFNLGLVFSIGMVLLAAGYILYQTSQVLAHYDPESYVAASLALFSSVALMFWYVIRIFMRARD